MSFFYDLHCHLNDPVFSEQDISVIISEMKKEKIKAIVVGYDLESSKRAISLSEKYPDVLRAIVGFHPVSGEKSVSLFSPELEKFLTHELVIGIGECGFDYNHLNKEKTFLEQKELLEKQLDLAIKYQKPVMFHLRNSKNQTDAYQDLLDILAERETKGEKVKGNVHFFTGSSEIADKFFTNGITVSLTGVITFSDTFDGLIENLPMGSFFLETDSPYVSPNPKRGEVNTPLNVKYLYEYVAKLKKIDVFTLESKIAESINRAYNF